MTMVWVLGWAVPEGWFAPWVYREFGDAEHVFISPGPEASARLEDVRSGDWLVGYSLGAHLLLSAAARGLRFERVSLLAPIFAFPQEESLGGRFPRTQVRYLSRWIRRDASAAMADFYSRAGLDVPSELYPKGGCEELLWGLARLEHDRVEPPAPPGWELWCGRDDALLDAQRLGEIAPSLHAVQGTHHPAALIQAMAENERRRAKP